MAAAVTARLQAAEQRFMQTSVRNGRSISKVLIFYFFQEAIFASVFCSCCLHHMSCLHQLLQQILKITRSGNLSSEQQVTHSTAPTLHQMFAMKKSLPILVKKN